jgi:hypothetical protein
MTEMHEASVVTDVSMSQEDSAQSVVIVVGYAM